MGERTEDHTVGRIGRNNQGPDFSFDFSQDIQVAETSLSEEDADGTIPTRGLRIRLLKNHPAVNFQLGLGLPKGV